MDDKKTLTHIGVLGMKWGRRKNPERVVSRHGKPQIVEGRGFRSKVTDRNPSREKVSDVLNSRRLVKHSPETRAKARELSNSIVAGFKRRMDERKAKSDAYEKQFNSDVNKADKLGEKYRADRAKAKAMISEGKKALQKASIDFDKSYNELPTLRLTTGEKITGVIVLSLAAAQVGLILANR